MPWIPLYCVAEDLDALLQLLSDEMAFIIPDGAGRWKAVESFVPTDGSRTALWHIPSGPLPLLHRDRDASDGVIKNPYSGWEEERAGADPATPYFGAGHPGIFWLNLRMAGHDAGSSCGLTSIEWIGKHYASIGNAPSELTVKRWAKLKRDIGKIAQKVPRGGRQENSRPEVWAFPVAFDRVQVGDINP